MKYRRWKSGQSKNFQGDVRTRRSRMYIKFEIDKLKISSNTHQEFLIEN